jgi:hypothetical protein
MRVIVRKNRVKSAFRAIFTTFYRRDRGTCKSQIAFENFTGNIANHVGPIGDRYD